MGANRTRVILSGQFNPVEERDLVAMIRDLRGEVVSDLDQATLCVVKAFKVYDGKQRAWDYTFVFSVKPLAFMAGGRPVVAPQYINQSHKRGFFLLDMKPFMSSMVLNTYEHVNEVEKRPLFCQWKVALLVKRNGRTQQDFSTTLKAGGAQVLLITSNNLVGFESDRNLNRLDYIFTEPAFLQDPHFSNFMAQRAQKRWPVQVLSFFFVVHRIRDPLSPKEGVFRIEDPRLAKALHSKILYQSSSKRKKAREHNLPRPSKRPNQQTVVILDSSDEEVEEMDGVLVVEDIMIVEEKLHPKRKVIQRRVKEEPAEEVVPHRREMLPQEDDCIDLTAGDDQTGPNTHRPRGSNWATTKKWVTIIDSGSEPEVEPGSEDECQVLNQFTQRALPHCNLSTKGRDIEIITVSSDDDEGMSSSGAPIEQEDPSEETDPPKDLVEGSLDVIARTISQDAPELEEIIVRGDPKKGHPDMAQTSLEAGVVPLPSSRQDDLVTGVKLPQDMDGKFHKKRGVPTSTSRLNDPVKNAKTPQDMVVESIEPDPPPTSSPTPEDLDASVELPRDSVGTCLEPDAVSISTSILVDPNRGMELPRESAKKTLKSSAESIPTSVPMDLESGINLSQDTGGTSLVPMSTQILVDTGTNVEHPKDTGGKFLISSRVPTPTSERKSSGTGVNVSQDTVRKSLKSNDEPISIPILDDPGEAAVLDEQTAEKFLKTDNATKSQDIARLEEASKSSIPNSISIGAILKRSTKERNTIADGMPAPVIETIAGSSSRMIVDLSDIDGLRSVIGKLIKHQKVYNDSLDIENLRGRTIRYDDRGDFRDNFKSSLKIPSPMDVIADYSSAALLGDSDNGNYEIQLVMQRVQGFINTETYPRAKSLHYILVNLVLNQEMSNVDHKFRAHQGFQLFNYVLHLHNSQSRASRLYYTSIFRWEFSGTQNTPISEDTSFWRFFSDIWTKYASGSSAGMPSLALQIILNCLQRDLEYMWKHGKGKKVVEEKPLIFLLFVKDSNVEPFLRDHLRRLDAKIYANPSIWRLHTRFMALIGLLASLLDHDVHLNSLHRRDGLKFKIAQVLTQSLAKSDLSRRSICTYLALLRPSWLSFLVSSSLSQADGKSIPLQNDANEAKRAENFQFGDLLRKNQVEDLMKDVIYQQNIAFEKFLATFALHKIHIFWWASQNQLSNPPFQGRRIKARPQESNIIPWDSKVFHDLSGLMSNLTLINQFHLSQNGHDDSVDRLVTVFRNKLLCRPESVKNI